MNPIERSYIAGNEAARDVTPSTELITEAAKRAPRFEGYRGDEAMQLIRSWREKYTAGDAKQFERNLLFLDSVQSTLSFARALKHEGSKPERSWSETTKRKAAESAFYSMFTADNLQREPELLKKFWDGIYRPLLASGGYSGAETDQRICGFMAEFAAGKALAQIFRGQGKLDRLIYKASPEEDLHQGRDLVISEGGKERFLQVKLLRGNGDTFVDWMPNDELRLTYRRSSDEIFDAAMGTPTPKLLEQMQRSMPTNLR